MSVTDYGDQIFQGKPRLLSYSDISSGSLESVYIENSGSSTAEYQYAGEAWGQRIVWSGSNTLLSFGRKMYRTGNPTGLLYFRIRKTSDASILATFGSIDVSTITTGSPEWYVMSGSWSPGTESLDIRLGFEWPSGSSDSNNRINCYYTNESSYPFLGNEYYTNSPDDSGSYDDQSFAYDHVIKISGSKFVGTEGGQYFKESPKFSAVPFDQSWQSTPTFLSHDEQKLRNIPAYSTRKDQLFKVSPHTPSYCVHQVWLNGVNVTTDTLSWDAEQSVTYGAWQANIVFKNTVPVSVFNTVEIFGVYEGYFYSIFKGVITTINQSLEEKILTCTALNYTYFLTFRLIFGKTYTEKKAHEIIDDLISTYMSDITTSNVYTGFTNVYTKTFDNITVFEAIRQIAEAEDADFYVTDDKDLYFKPKTQASTGSITLAQGENIFSMSKELKDDRLFNWINVTGGTGFVPANRDDYTDSGSLWGYSGSDGAGVSYDYSVKYTGSCSIKCTSSSSGSDTNLFYYPETQDLDWIFGRIIDAMCFRMRSDISSYTQAGWTGSTPIVELHYDETKYAYQAIPIQKWQTNTWINKSLEVGSGSSGWTLTGSFNWCSDPVNYIQFRVQTPSGSSASHYLWIDNLYFHENQIQVTKQDTGSQAAYRRRDMYKSDTSIMDYTYLIQWAQTQLDLYKDPYVKLSVTAKYMPGQVSAGQKVLVTAADYGYVNEPFTVISCRFVVSEGELYTQLELSPVIPLETEEVLAKMRKEMNELLRRTA